jgi:uncharacterized protein
VRLLVDKITDISRAYTLCLAAAELNCMLSQAQEDSSGPFVSDALVTYRLSRADRRLMLDGELAADLTLQCGRCLTTLPGRLHESFAISLNIVDEEGSTEEELELDDEQINSITHVEGEIDLLPVLQEQLLMALPIFSLCGENCSGLCPYCGNDLNKSRCSCEPKHFNNRFGKLKDLKLDPS